MEKPKREQGHPLMRQEELEKPKSRPKPEDVFHTVMEAIDILEEDLEANRQNYVSKRQRFILYARVKKLTRTIAVIAISLFIIDGIALFSNIYGDVFSYRLSVSFLITLIGLCPIALVYVKMRKYKLDLRKGVVSSVEGNLKLTYYSSRGYVSCTAKIDKTWFDINRKVFLALREFEKVESNCIIYYTPYSKTILSIEWLRD